MRGFRDELAGEQGAAASAEATAAHVAEVAASRFAPLEVSQAHLKIIHDAMDAVSNHERGTAYRSRITEEDWALAGKTGTSQVRRITLSERQSGVRKNEDLEWRYRDHGLFVAYAPVHRPRYCCAVVVEHGGSGSRSAAPIVRDILSETQRRDPSAAGLRPLAAAGAGRET